MKISIVTPSYNQGKYIAETLKSVQQASENLDGVEVEHIVMDGGSQDETINILKSQEFAKWVSRPDQGQTDAINKGLERSTGEILTYLCSDDLYEKNCLNEVVQVFQQQIEVDVVYGDYYFLEGASKWRRLKKAGPFSVSRLKHHNFISQPATFWRRSVYEKFGGFDRSLRFCMDHEYWLRIVNQTQWYYLNKPLAVMRLHSDSKTCSKLVEAWEETADMVKKYGLEDRFNREVLIMRWFGQYYYWLKRKLFERAGYLLRRDNKD